MALVLEIAAVAAWFVIVVTGKLPRGLFDVMVASPPVGGASSMP